MKFYLIIGFLILNLLGSVVMALPNPASVNCVNNNGKSVLEAGKGFCLFEDGTYCEEWAYFRGQCQPGQTKWTGENDNSK